MDREETIRILIVDDDSVDAKILCRYLAEIGKYTIETEYVESLDPALEQLHKQDFDLIFLDNRLSSGVTAAEVIERFKEEEINIPVVVVTGQGDQRIAVDLMKKGAYDYITKNDLTAEALEKTIHNTIERYRLIIMQKQAEEKIINLAKFPNENPHAVLRISKDYKILYANKASELILQAWKSKEGQYLQVPERKLIDEALRLAEVTNFDLNSGGRTFSVTMTPIVEPGYVNIYGHDITGRKQMEENLRCAKERAEKARKETEQVNEELKTTYKKLIETSRRAGMAEVATDVLHNVGNVLNSVNVSATLIVERIMNSEVSNLERLVDMMHEHEDDMDNFLINDPKGKHIPTYLAELSKYLINERAEIFEKSQSLVRNIDYIKEIVGMQQSYAKTAGVEVATAINEVVEDAIQINSAGLERNRITLVCEYAEFGNVTMDRQRVLQILVNLIGNAKDALLKSSKEERIVTIRYYKNDEKLMRIDVVDNGIGIAEENLTKIFQHGFTTKKHGHGFGLHSSALAAKEMGGALTVQSEGIGQGTTLTLELPFKPAEVTCNREDGQVQEELIPSDAN